MRRINKRTVLAAALVFVAALAVRPAVGDEPPQHVILEAQGRQALEDWEYQRAGEIAGELLKLAQAPDASDAQRFSARVFRGQYYFYSADYENAAKEFEAAGAIMALPERTAAFRDRSQALAKLWKGGRKKSSEHFTINWVEPKDQVLAEPGLMVLEKSFEVLTKHIGGVTGGKVRVEIYPSFEDFSAATGLSNEDLENSGTIAVCKYRRLMINSPRILARGYTWRDTLSHEFVHFLVYERFKEAVPIWLHEGIAKSLESQWRGGDHRELLPSQASLLAGALKMNELITFDRMHPSFAKLKDPKQGQLAFAEVHSAVGYLVEKGGWDLVFKLCDELGRTPDYRAAVARAAGEPFDAFWQGWIGYAKRQGYKELPGMEITLYEIRKGEDLSGEDDEVGAADLAEGEEWKYVRLGDLLRQRGHTAAAIPEYEKALEIAPYNPRILNKLGQTRNQLGDFEAALEPLNLAAKMAPGFSTTYLNLGRSLLGLNRVEEGEKALLAILEINPFNPIPYHLLGEIYRQQKRSEDYKRLIRDYAVISGEMPPEEIGAPAGSTVK